MRNYYAMGRKPKQEGGGYEGSDPLPNEDDEFAEFDEGGEDEVDEEVDFDNPTFKRDQIWNDYAEDLDFDD